MKLMSQDKTIMKSENQQTDDNVPDKNFSKTDTDKEHLDKYPNVPLVSKCEKETQTGGRYVVKRTTSGAPPGYRKKMKKQEKTDFKWITF